jgi:predicted GNAT family N-acyltransferase
MTDRALRRADWAQDQAALRKVRELVFIQEQRVPEALEWDGLDEGATHLLCEVGGRAIATARMLTDGHIGRMAVLAEHRNLGIGSTMLMQLMEIARERGLCEVWLDAQVQAIPFYEKLGFNAEGETFMDAGIPHRRMRKTLGGAPPMHNETSMPDTPSTPEETLDLDGFTLGESREEIALHDAEQNRAVIRRMTEQARHSLYILSAELDPELYSSREYAEELGRFVRLHRRGEVRILIRDNRRIVKQTHFLLSTIRQYSSQIFVRRLRARRSDRAIVLADESGVVFRERDDLYRGVAYFHNPMLAKELHEEFKRLWDFSEPDPDLRQLSY